MILMSRAFLPNNISFFFLAGILYIGFKTGNKLAIYASFARIIIKLDLCSLFVASYL